MFKSLSIFAVSVSMFAALNVSAEVVSVSNRIAYSVGSSQERITGLIESRLENTAKRRVNCAQGVEEIAEVVQGTISCSSANQRGNGPMVKQCSAEVEVSCGEQLAEAEVCPDRIHYGFIGIDTCELNQMRGNSEGESTPLSQRWNPAWP